MMKMRSGRGSEGLKGKGRSGGADTCKRRHRRRQLWNRQRRVVCPLLQLLHLLPLLLLLRSRIWRGQVLSPLQEEREILEASQQQCQNSQGVIRRVVSVMMVSLYVWRSESLLLRPKKRNRKEEAGPRFPGKWWISCLGSFYMFRVCSYLTASCARSMGKRISRCSRN